MMSKKSRYLNKHSSSKEKKVRIPAHGVGDSQFTWCSKNIDLESEWSFVKLDVKILYQKVLPTLQEFSKLTWGEIERQTHGSRNKSKHHCVNIESLCDEARLRLEELDVEGIGMRPLFSLRIDGKARIYSFRDRSLFELLWWDAEHQICPSKKKNT